MTANLQTGLTVKQAAALMNVSERMVYMCRAIHNLRPDLAEEVSAGRMTVNRAYRTAKGKPDRAERKCPHCGVAS